MEILMITPMHLCNRQNAGDRSNNTFCKVDRYEVSCDADDRYSDAQQLAHSIVLRLLGFTSGLF